MAAAPRVRCLEDDVRRPSATPPDEHDLVSHVTGALVVGRETVTDVDEFCTHPMPIALVAHGRTALRHVFPRCHPPREG